MLRLIELTYIVPLTEVEKYVAVHREYLQQYFDQGYFIVSGPKDPREGGMILAVGNVETLATIMEGDPYYKNKIATYKITSFQPVKMSKGFESALSNLVKITQ